MNLKAALFDLDNTLYSQDVNLFSQMNVRINEYMQSIVGIPKHDVDRLRIYYWKKYGLTLIGLMRHHQVEAEDYLSYIHDIDINNVIVPNKELYRTIQHIPLKKFILTNSCKEYAEKVLSALQIRELFDIIFDIRTSAFKPKPAPEAYKLTLQCIGYHANECAFIDDSLENVKTAWELGMKTILIGESSEFFVSCSAQTPVQAAQILKKWTETQL